MTAATGFPVGFRWGASTSAYQVEGAADTDGRGASVWDTFSHQPGRTVDGATGDVAADQFHRYADDVALMQQLGLHSYRFSISWSRVLPTGRGEVNQKGLDYYRRLIDALNAAGIKPMATLWHSDTPQALQDMGGWEFRDTAKYFADYAAIVFSSLGADVATYLTINEPKTVVSAGYLWGSHPPGKQDPAAATTVMHHLLLGHGLAVQAFRASGVTADIGLALGLVPVYPADDSPESAQAAELQDCWENRLYLEPIYQGRYPQAGLAEVADERALQAVNKEGDLATIATPIDILAVNYYYATFVGPGREVVHKYPLAHPSTWLEIYPEGLYDILTRVDRDYGKPRMQITENGRPTITTAAADGTFSDDDRIAFLRDHLIQARRALQDGVNLEGYSLWSFMDNFEWSEGFEQRFGIIHVDFETLNRTPKKSFYWYADLIASNGASLSPP